MLSNRKLIGLSYLPDGFTKLDYLSRATIQIGGANVSFVVRVVPDGEPMQLGLNLLAATRMSINFQGMTFEGEVQDANSCDSACAGQFLTYDRLLQRAGIAENELVPVDTLPPVTQAAAELVKSEAKMPVVAGKAHGKTNTNSLWLGYSK